jgi:hypothetical protein
MVLDQALLHLVGTRHADAQPSAQGSDRQGELVERDRHALVTGSSTASS